MTWANNKATVSSNGDAWKAPPLSSTFLLTLWGPPSTLCRHVSDRWPSVLDSGILQSSQGFSKKVQTIGLTSPSPVTSSIPMFSLLPSSSLSSPSLLYFLPSFFPLLSLFFIFFFRLGLCSPGWTGIHCVAQVSFHLEPIFLPQPP